jgi:hypothetical protein
VMAQKEDGGVDQLPELRSWQLFNHEFSVIDYASRLPR